MARITKASVKDFFDRQKTNYGEDLSQYSWDALVFSFLLGMSPRECEGMYPEDEEIGRLYDQVDGIMSALRREGKL